MTNDTIVALPKLTEVQRESESTLILLYEDDNSEPLQQMLQAIIGAVKLDPNTDVKIVFLPNNSRTIVTNLSAFTNIILFGIEPSHAGIHSRYAKYHILPLEKQTMIVSDSIKSLAQDKQKKNALWQALKGLFLSN